MRIVHASIIAALVGCANDPAYIPSPDQLMGGMTDMMGEPVTPKSTLILPVKIETAKDAADRATLAGTLGVMVPYVKVGDIAVEIEWTIQNLDTMPGVARVNLNGGNEYFIYDPSMLDYSGGDDEAPPTPQLSGNIPIDVAPGETIQGSFREDEVLEASIDLDMITRGNINPFAATLKVDKNDTSFQPVTIPMATMADPMPMPVPTGPVIPRAAFAHMIQYDLTFSSSTKMMFQYAVRIRDLRGIMDDKLLDAPVGELTQFMPPAYSNM